NLKTADSILAIDQHPKSSHPLIEGDRRILKYRSYFDGELLIAVVAEPNAASLDETVLRSFAARAGNFPVRPAQLHGIVERPLRIGEINNRLLQSLWFLHVVIVAYVRLCVKYIITIPSHLIPERRALAIHSPSCHPEQAGASAASDGAK